MSLATASPHGIGLPCTSLYTVGSRETVASRPAEYFWKKAISPSTPRAQELTDTGPEPTQPDSSWLEADAPAISESEAEEGICSPPASHVNKPKSFSKLRRIYFRHEETSPPVTTGILSNQSELASKTTMKRFKLFQTWKIKSKGAKSEVKRVLGAVKTRISRSSPPEQHPKTWEDYNRCYANEEIDVNSPPLPPMEPALEDAPPTPFQNKAYCAPTPANEPIRQLVVNRLALYGNRHFDSSEAAVAKAKERIELGDMLIEQGREPQSVVQAWEGRHYSSTEAGHDGIPDTQALSPELSTDEPPPETLEHHPVFRRIVKQCRIMFGTSISFMAVLDDDRQTFIAEAGLGGLREVPRDMTFCAHTILSGRKGFAVLDTHKDWRFAGNPMSKRYGVRFYAGVPLMAPNLDGSIESEDNACPVGTLCVVDDKPREEFSALERKKLVYMAEYARREIEQWFLKKMEHKQKMLEASQDAWHKELDSLSKSESAEDAVISEVMSAIQRPTCKSQQSFRRVKNPKFNVSAPLSSQSPSMCANASLKSALLSTSVSVFEDITVAVRPRIQRFFDFTTNLIGQTLDLSLVYLIAVAPHGELQGFGRTKLISAHNLPVPPPAFDAGLHLRVLRAPEGGMLYQNPSTKEAEDASLQPQAPGSKGPKPSSGTGPYVSAMLVAVGPPGEPHEGGFVLAGFTTDAKRVFGGEDVSYLKQFAQELARHTSKVKL